MLMQGQVDELLFYYTENGTQHIERRTQKKAQEKNILTGTQKTLVLLVYIPSVK